MSILRDVQRLIDLAEGKHPRLEKWALCVHNSKIVYEVLQ